MSTPTCCNQNCRSGRDCPNRKPRDLTKWERRVGLVLLAVLVAGLLREIAK